MPEIISVKKKKKKSNNYNNNEEGGIFVELVGQWSGPNAGINESGGYILYYIGDTLGARWVVWLGTWTSHAD